jgi:hypothetical protein
MTIDPHLYRIVTAQVYPLLFASISGVHLAGQVGKLEQRS